MRLHLGSAILGLAMLAFLTPSFARAAEDEATVICKDGATSKGGRGACRGHGGVDKAATAKAAGATAGAAAKAEGKAAAAEGKAEVKKGEAAAAKKGDAAAAKADEAAGEATVVCKDGATSKGGRGACRGHGGVDKTATAKGAGGAAAAAATARIPATPAEPAAPPPPAASAPAKTTSTAAAAQRVERQVDDKKGPPSARCKDGTLSYAQHHTGACSRHGGVEEWLDKK